MKPQRFRQAVEALDELLDEFRLAGASPTDVLALLDKSLSRVKWHARPDDPETKADALGNAGTLVLVVRMEVRR